MKKELLIIIVILILGVTSVITITSLNKKDSNKIDLKDGNGSKEVIVDNVTFSEITNTYDDGITTITAKMVNNTKETKNIKLEITLKDNDGKIVSSMVQIVEDLQPNKPKTLMTGIAGDYSHITKIEFKTVK